MKRKPTANDRDEFFQTLLAEVKPARMRKVQREFFDWAESYLASKGAIDCYDTGRGHHSRFSLNTPIGEYRMSFSPGNILCGIMGRFEREKAGYAFTRGASNESNRYSGKWNHQYDGDNEYGLTADDGARHNFAYWIDKIVAYVPTPAFWAEVVRLEIEQEEMDRGRTTQQAIRLQNRADFRAAELGNHAN